MSRGGELDECCALKPSKRSLQMPVALVDQLVEQYKDHDQLVNLCVGGVFYGPSPGAWLETSTYTGSAAQDAFYGRVQGEEALIDAIFEKLKVHNGWDARHDGYQVMITAGANQALVNLLLTLCDAGDGVVLFAPYYFSYLSACIQCNVVPVVVDRLPYDTAWEAMQASLVSDREDLAIGRIKAVVVCTPDNPTGSVMSNAELQSLSDACHCRGWWLVVDEAYEHFEFGSQDSVLPCGRSRPYGMNQSSIHVFTMSKSFGMAGYRVGYVAYPAVEGAKGRNLHDSLLKINDTVATHACRSSQRLAANVLRDPGCVSILQARRLQIRLFWEDVVAVVERLVQRGVVRWVSRPRAGNGVGAFYVFLQICARIPSTDITICHFLANHFDVLVAPGQVFGMQPEDCCLRIAFGSLPCNHRGRVRAALERLGAGIITFCHG